MFGIGFFELVLIAAVALIFVGPQKLPEVMKQAGRFFVQMRRAANEVKSTFDGVIRQAEDEIRREEADAMRALLAKNSTPTTATALDPARPTGSTAGNTDEVLKNTASKANVPPGTQTYASPQKHSADHPGWDNIATASDQKPESQKDGSVATSDETNETNKS
jgi:Tat protein translocase TatB subunit